MNNIPSMPPEAYARLHAHPAQPLAGPLARGLEHGAKVYIAGPMSGLPDFNYPAFFRAASQLAAVGVEPINPARAESREGASTWLDFMRLSLVDIAACDGVATLPGYAASRGASIEVRLADALGLPVRPVEEWTSDPACPGRRAIAEGGDPE